MAHAKFGNLIERWAEHLEATSSRMDADSVDLFCEILPCVGTREVSQVKLHQLGLRPRQPTVYRRLDFTGEIRRLEGSAESALASSCVRNFTGEIAVAEARAGG